MLYFGVYYVYSVFTSLRAFTFLNDVVDLTTSRMLILYSENSTFGAIISWSGRVSILLVIGGSGRIGSGRVASHKMDSCTFLLTSADVRRYRRNAARRRSQWLPVKRNRLIEGVDSRRPLPRCRKTPAAR